MIFAGSPLVVGSAIARSRAAYVPEPVTEGRERRESDRVIAYWERKKAQLGAAPTMKALDLAAIHTEDWSHRFVIASDPVVAHSSLLLYGPDFARLANLPAKSTPHLPMAVQLSPRLSKVCMDGCGKAHAQNAPVRLEGEIDLGDGGKVLYRAAFIPVGLSPLWPTHFTLGAFNSCVTP